VLSRTVRSLTTTHFYRHGALGDISDLQRLPAEVSAAKTTRVHPALRVATGLDDPISTWRTVAANEGFIPGHPARQVLQPSTYLLVPEVT
jgi:hypothetical protein